MSTSPTLATNSFVHHYPGPHKCVVFWDYENINVPHGCALRTVISVLKERIWNKLDGKQIPIRFKLYIRAEKLNAKIKDEMDVNGIEHINISSRKPESVDKRMLVDIALHLYELEKDKKSHAIALISGDKDFGHLLSRMHKEAPISHSLLILWNAGCVNPNLSNNVDFVINDFNDCSFKICPNKYCKTVMIHDKCRYFHPANVLDYSSEKVSDFGNRRNRNKKQSSKPNKKRRRKAANYNTKINNNSKTYTKHSYSYVMPQPAAKRSKVDQDSDSSIEIIDNYTPSHVKSDKITIRLQQHGTDNKDMIEIDRDSTVKEIMHQIRMKYNIPSDIKLLYNGINIGPFMYTKLNKIQSIIVSDGDSLTWMPNDYEDIDENSNNNNNNRPNLQIVNQNVSNGLASKPPALELDAGKGQITTIDLT